jgi:Type III restriction enzyme, res subunit
MVKKIMLSSICSEKYFNSFSSLSSLNENKKPSEAINSTVSTIFNQSLLFQEIQNLHEKAVTTSIPLDCLECMQKLLVKIREISTSSLSNDQRYLLINYICKVAVTQTEHKFKACAFKTYVFAFDFLLKNRKTLDLTIKDREILLEKFSESILICSKKMTAFDQDLLYTIEECVQLVTNRQLDKSKEIIQSFLEKNKRKLNTCVIETNKKPRLENNYPVNVYPLQDINLNDLHAIEKHVDQLKQEQKLTFDDYQEASDYFNFSKQLLVNKILLDNFSQLDSLAKLNSLELLVQMVHPFPTSAKIRASELEILDRIRLTCKELLTTPYKLQAKNIETKINSLQINLEFNYTYFMSLKINEKMNALIYCYSLEVETEENAKLDYQTVVQMIKQDINLFETFKTNCQKFGERSKEKVCIQQLALKYKKLATYLVDVAKFSPSEEKPKVLTQVIESYELVKIYRVRKLEKINLNIIVSRYELASYLKKSRTREAYLKELNTIRSHLHRDLSPRKFHVSYPDVIFYELSLLAAIYAETQDESTLQEALKELDFFANIYQKANLAKSQTLDIINWLQNFSTIFQSKNPLTFSNLPIYSLPSLLNPYWRQERQQQFLNGLDQLISHNFSKNYAINLKPHQIEAIKKCVELLLANKRKGYFCLPTGAGKTYLMLMISLAVKMPTLIIVPTHTLIEQTIQNIQKLDPTIQVSRFDGLVKQHFFGQVLVTTYNSLQNDFKSENPKISLKSFGLVWADEAHHCLTLDRAAIIQTLEETAYVFGLTATDCYNTKRQKEALSHVKDVFGDKIFEIELEHLIESSQLSPVKNIIVHAPNFPSHAKKLKKNKNTDYTDAELAELINVTRCATF